MAQSNNDCGRVRRPHRHERTMFAVATNPHATVVARAGPRPPRALPRVRALFASQRRLRPFSEGTFFALFETVRRSSDASARARRYIRAVPLADRACAAPRPNPIAAAPDARDLAVEQGGDVAAARRWPPRSAARHPPVARNDPRMPCGFAHPPHPRPSSSLATSGRGRAAHPRIRVEGREDRPQPLLSVAVGLVVKFVIPAPPGYRANRGRSRHLPLDHRRAGAHAPARRRVGLLRPLHVRRHQDPDLPAGVLLR